MAGEDAVNQIRALAERRLAAYRELDAGEAEMMGSGTLRAIVKRLRNSARYQTLSDRQAELVNTIHALRAQMDELRKQKPLGPGSEIDRYWNVEYSTSHSQLREWGRLRVRSRRERIRCPMRFQPST